MVQMKLLILVGAIVRVLVKDNVMITVTAKVVTHEKF